MSVDGHGVAFPQTQVARHALHFLPDLAIVQVQNHLVRQALDADEVRDEVFRAVRCRGISGGCGVFAPAAGGALGVAVFEADGGGGRPVVPRFVVPGRASVPPMPLSRRDLACGAG